MLASSIFERGVKLLEELLSVRPPERIGIFEGKGIGSPHRLPIVEVGSLFMGTLRRNIGFGGCIVNEWHRSELERL